MKEKNANWKNKFKTGDMMSIVIVCIIITIFAGIFAYRKQREYKQVMENQYNMAFFELVDYMQNVEAFLAKATISSTAEHSAQTLANVWREANLAGAYLSQLPITNNELSNTSKFLNQVSDYSYTLYRKNIYKEDLTEEELLNLQTLYNYSIELTNTLKQLSSDINEGKIKWGELTNKGSFAFAQQVSNISADSFGSLNENLQEYAGLIYDGAFSEHVTSVEKKGITGENITQEKAKQIAIDFIGQERIENTKSYGLSGGDISAYTFSMKMTNMDKNNNAYIDISKKGGHVVQMNFYRNIGNHNIEDKQAIQLGKDFLSSKGFSNMKETYYLKEDGVITINYAFNDNGVIVYTDLIKLKIALDNGEMLGIETIGYLNSHTNRDISIPKISKEEAKKNLNKNLEILSENLVIIPTKFKTEILCWEFKGHVDSKEFLVYINAENGREENILVVYNTPNRYFNYVSYKIPPYLVFSRMKTFLLVARKVLSDFTVWLVINSQYSFKIFCLFS